MVKDNFILFYSLVAEQLAKKPEEIRPMTKKERQRAKEREEANNGE
tara:strand:+ start:90 stop:227 length:138 start_codon:yes stop_codon:yes gene_type:complete